MLYFSTATRNLLLPPGFWRNHGAHVSVVLDVIGDLGVEWHDEQRGLGKIGAKRKREGEKAELISYAPIFFAIPPLLGSLATQFLAMTKPAKAIFSGLALAIVAPDSITGSITHSPSELTNL